MDRHTVLRWLDRYEHSASAGTDHLHDVFAPSGTYLHPRSPGLVRGWSDSAAEIAY